MLTSRLALFEAENSIRVMGVSSQLDPLERQLALETLARAILEGFINVRDVPIRRLYPAARRLSQYHSNKVGYGAMDILHVASALDLGADILLTFDVRQADLGRAEGLKVPLV